jgi:hypothetical protein
MDRDDDGFRTYTIKFLVETDDPKDGPYLALGTVGLPQVGDVWDFDNDYDPWCYCRLPVKVTPEATNEPNLRFELEFSFSNKPDKDRCKLNEVTNPLLIPWQISGSFVKFHEEGRLDRFGLPIVNSAHEVIRGPQNEWDANRPQIKIEQNVLDLQLPMLCQMSDTLNMYPMWGLPARTIKLTVGPWSRKFYGHCFVYYTRTLEFDIRYRISYRVEAEGSFGSSTSSAASPQPEGFIETYDRLVLDEGTKVLRGKWDTSTGKLRWVLTKIAGKDPDQGNPTHFIRAQDQNGNPIRLVLNGAGLPAFTKAQYGPRYISLENSNVGQSLSDRDWWIPLAGPFSPMPAFSFSSSYPPGSLVSFEGNVYIQTGLRSSEAGQDPGAGDPWLILAGTIVDQGVYSSSTSYVVGDVVKDLGNVESPGYNFISKYAESDFSLLGIPTDALPLGP